jgi:hypothetical protein
MASDTRFVDRAPPASPQVQVRPITQETLRRYAALRDSMIGSIVRH